MHLTAVSTFLIKSMQCVCICVFVCISSIIDGWMDGRRGQLHEKRLFEGVRWGAVPGGGWHYFAIKAQLTRITHAHFHTTQCTAGSQSVVVIEC